MLPKENASGAATWWWHCKRRSMQSWRNWFHTGFRAVGLNVLCPRIHQQLPLELLASAISLTDALRFSFALTATLWFKRGLPPMRTRADLKGITNAAVPLYGSTRCHLMVQGTLSRNAPISELLVSDLDERVGLSSIKYHHSDRRTLVDSRY